MKKQVDDLIEEVYNPKDWKTIGYKRFCHHIKNRQTQETVLIPQCWNVVISNDIEDCVCHIPKYEGVEPKFTEVEKELREYIFSLEEQLKVRSKL